MFENKFDSINDNVSELMFDKKLEAQIHRMDFDKWLEGEKTHTDPGDPFRLQWISEHGEEFHKLFSKSDCMTCTKYNYCGGSCCMNCENYNPEVLEQTKHIIIKIINFLKTQNMDSKIIETICQKYKIKL